MTNRIAISVKLQMVRLRFLRRSYAGLAVFSLGILLTLTGSGLSQNTAAEFVSELPGRFRVGERLTYSVSMGRFTSAAFFETSVISGGSLGGRQAVELRSRTKTLGLVSATFYQLDESRVVFAAPDTGMPLYMVVTDNLGAMPKDTVSNYLTQPSSNFDLLTLMFAARQTGGVGTFPIWENGQVYAAAFQTSGVEKVDTQAGVFDTTVSTVQSDYLTAIGIKDLRINFASDQHHVPVLIRFKTSKGEFRVTLSAIQLPEPEIIALVTPAPAPVPVVVKPIPAIDIYVNNRPLLPELGFQLGELLEYRITSGGRPIGVMALSVQERKLFQNDDSLLLTATVTGVEPGVQAFRLGEAMRVQVNPDTLAPRWAEGAVESSALLGLKQTLSFDKLTGNITFAAEKPVDAPIGTHTIVSLIYAMRSFNLQPSKDPNNPVNDTRVAVFWESKPYVFTLRPSTPAEITLNGQLTPAQLVTINTGVPQLDLLAPKVWLGADSRIPLRFSIGLFQADLIPQVTTITR